MNHPTLGNTESAMPNAKKTMSFLEEHIPELARSAVTQAY